MAAGNNRINPRQRMINLMYLVLTAMLALQVSSSMVDKFIFLNDSLEHSLDASLGASEQALDALEKKIAEDGNTADGQKNIQKAKDLRKKSTQLIGYIDQLKSHLIKEAAGGVNRKTGLLNYPEEETEVETYMIGATGKGKAYELKEKLDQHVDYLYQEFKELGFERPEKRDAGAFPYLAEGNEDREIYRNDPIQRNKDFAEANFGQTPVVAALAVLTQKQNEIVRYEQEVFKRLGVKNIAMLPKFNKIVALASADAKTIASGTDYTANMLLAASTDRQDLRMYVNGQEVRVKDGMGQVRIPTAQPGQKQWKGEIRMKIRGKDTVFRFTENFQVVQPVLLINNKNKFPLYQNCANELETAVPALAANYDPAFQASNGKIIPGPRLGDVTLVPSQVGECELIVRSGGQVVGQQKFAVNPVPRPSIYIGNANKREIDPSQPIPNVPKVYVWPRPDETFARTLPNEANYQLGAIEVLQFRSNKAMARQTFTNGVIDMTQFQRRPGDIFQVKAVNMTRLNFQGKPEPANPVNPYLAFRSQ